MKTQRLFRKNLFSSSCHSPETELSRFLLAFDVQKGFPKPAKREVIKSLFNKELDNLRTIHRQISVRTWSQIDRVLEEAKAADISVWSLAHRAYPRRLLHTPDPPLVLFAAVGGGSGELREEGFSDVPVVAIVGTRKVTDYGRRVAMRLGREIAARGAVVVSGLARGVDSAAHQGALNLVHRENCFSANDKWSGAAVLGSGVCEIYPKSNTRLAEDLLANGGVLISEYHPRAKPTRYTFPQRNRIVSGLSDVLIVVEAAERSGALISAAAAAEQGREVFAVPGPVDSPMSVGPNALLALGVSPVRSADDICAALPHLPWRDAETAVKALQSGQSKSVDTALLQKALQGCAAEDGANIKALFGLLSCSGGCHFDALAEELNGSVSSIRALLTALECQELVFQQPGDRFSLEPYVDS